MVIIDAGEYVDLIALSDMLARFEVANPMAASSFIAEEVCQFYVSDLAAVRGDNFIVVPKPKYRRAFYKAHREGLLDSRYPWNYMAASLKDNFFDLRGLGDAMRHMDYLYRPMKVSPVNNTGSGLLMAELRG